MEAEKPLNSQEQTKMGDAATPRNERESSPNAKTLFGEPIDIDEPIEQVRERFRKKYKEEFDKYWTWDEKEKRLRRVGNTGEGTK